MAAIEPRTYIGVDTITRQIERRLLKRGFDFNIMIVGQSGLGKSTLVNTLFAATLTQSHGRTRAEDPIARTPEIVVNTHSVVENGVKLNLTIIDTPGYGDQVNNDNCWEPAIKYIKDQQAFHLRKELTAARDTHIHDTRVHCVIFCIEPTGHRLKPLDVTVLKRLCEVANVVPIIAKSDSLTLAEREAFKHRLQQQFVEHNLRLYPYDNPEYDDDERQYSEMIRAMIPFAIVSSEKTELIDDREVPVRHNRWGVVNIEDTTHCEFTHLRSFLIRTHLQDLIDTTINVHYEGFRSRQLRALKESAKK